MMQLPPILTSFLLLLLPLQCTSFISFASASSPSLLTSTTHSRISALHVLNDEAAVPARKKITIKKREKKGTEFSNEGDNVVLSDVEFYKQEEAAKAAANSDTPISTAPIVAAPTTVVYSQKSLFRANAGFVVGVDVNNRGKETTHTLIVGDSWIEDLAGSEYILSSSTVAKALGGEGVTETLRVEQRLPDNSPGPLETPPDHPLGPLAYKIACYTMHFILEKGSKIDNTEGMIDASVFPINYFSARQVTYFWDDAEEVIGGYLKEDLEL